MKVQVDVYPVGDEDALVYLVKTFVLKLGELFEKGGTSPYILAIFILDAPVLS